MSELLNTPERKIIFNSLEEMHADEFCEYLYEIWEEVQCEQEFKDWFEENKDLLALKLINLGYKIGDTINGTFTLKERNPES